ncbi:hypothetical protein [Mesorhizobium sp. B2-3-4]|uniref:hypothetical protein n=1 Tax=Mesorhizobium sp. B2-3-4 TaxID=2589959 RepID=UPI00112C8A65|nr:hypothetical protein [Mesorhizobium sp. B2-3-4]TPM41713.1 hypothetical protein FJ967_01930 [Mesorhizobium sp. B2-3-4]
MAPQEAIDYFYQSLIGDSINIPTEQRSDDVAYDVYLGKMDRLEKFLAKESYVKEEEASKRARDSAALVKPSGAATARSQTLIPSK